MKRVLHLHRRLDVYVGSIAGSRCPLSDSWTLRVLGICVQLSTVRLGNDFRFVIEHPKPASALPCSPCSDIKSLRFTWRPFLLQMLKETPIFTFMYFEISTNVSFVPRAKLALPNCFAV